LSITANKVENIMERTTDVIEDFFIQFVGDLKKKRSKNTA